jgi:hypothetical protein
LFSLECTRARPVDAALRRRWPELPEPIVLPWSEHPVIALDGDKPWLYAPVERDPLTTARGHTILPRREIRRLRRMAALDVPFERLVIAHELDPRGAVGGLLPELRRGPRTCTPLVARAVVGPQPGHPAVRRTAAAIDAFVRRGVAAADGATALLDPIVLAAVGLPGLTHGLPALCYPLAAWRW